MRIELLAEHLNATRRFFLGCGVATATTSLLGRDVTGDEVATVAGEYHLRCRTIDANGVAQPMPRPFPKSGRNSIQQVTVVSQTPR